MKISQPTPPFAPISLVIQTREEADAFWGILCDADAHAEPHVRKLANELSDWFSDNAKL